MIVFFLPNNDYISLQIFIEPPEPFWIPKTLISCGSIENSPHLNWHIKKSEEKILQKNILELWDPLGSFKFNWSLELVLSASLSVSYEKNFDGSAPF